MSRLTRWDDLPLFATDAEIGGALLGPIRAGEFKGQAVLLEGRGFPKIDPRFGARYTPAVKRFFDIEYGLADTQPKNPGGVERPDTWTKKKTA